MHKLLDRQLQVVVSVSFFLSKSESFYYFYIRIQDTKWYQLVFKHLLNDLTRDLI